jgi:hypothetical protein
VADRLGRTHRRRAVVVHLNDETAASAEKPAHERIAALHDDRVRVLVNLDAEPLGNPRLEELVEGAPPAAAGIGLTSHHTTVSLSRVRSPVTSKRKSPPLTLLDVHAHTGARHETARAYAIEEGRSKHCAGATDQHHACHHRRYVGVDVIASTKSSARSNETLVPKLRELPGFAGYYLIGGSSGVLSSLGLFETSEQADQSTTLVSKWMTEYVQWRATSRRCQRKGISGCTAKAPAMCAS